MKRLFYILAALTLLVSCGGEVDPPEPEKAPELLKTVPEDGAAGIKEGNLEVVFTFDQNVRCGSDTRNVSIDNDADVLSIRAFDKEVTVSIGGITAGNSYTLRIAAGTIKGFRANQDVVKELTLTFSSAKKDPYVPAVSDPADRLVNPKASAEAQKVYNLLLEENGKHMLSGAMSGTSNSNDHCNSIAELTGKHPALSGYDFIFLQYSPTPENWSWVQNYNDISAATEQWNAGGLVSYMWHWNVPTSEQAWKNGLEKYNFDGYAFYSDKTAFDINRALTAGTWENEFILKDIEEVAGYLKNLQDAGIPVIWRPLHEAAGNYDLYGDNCAWFWWGKGGAEACKKLWMLLYDKLVNEHGLDNLIWVWTLDATPGAEEHYAEWYPGNDYVDIIGVDIYEDNTDAKARQYQAALDLCGGKKLVTISECGNIPDPEKCLDAAQAWSWFMVWPSDKGWPLNTNNYWKNLMGSDKVLTREELSTLLKK